MKRKLFVATCLVMLVLTASAAWANAIPPQVTLSSSTTGSVVFTNAGSAVDVAIKGTLSGNAILDLGANTVSGKYWMWLVGGPLVLTGGSSDYTVNMGTSTLYLEVKLGPGGNGSLGDLKATLALTDLFGAAGSTPQFVGSFTPTVASIDFHGLFPGLPGEADFTVKLLRKGLAPWKMGAAVSGYVSSGEFVPAVPEPSSLALMGTGVLGIAALIRRKIR